MIDCSGLGFLSSGGLAAMLSARKQAQRYGGKIYFSHVSSLISEVLERTKLNGLFAIYPTTEDALSRLDKSALTVTS